MTGHSAVDVLADEVLQVQAAFDPLNATMLGVAGHDGRLPDPSGPAEQELRRLAAGLADRAGRFDPGVVGRPAALTAAVAAQQAQAVVDRIDARLVEYAVTDFNYVGAAAVLLSLMPVAPLADADRAEAYLARLRAIPQYLDAVTRRHRLGIAAGRLPVARMVDAAVAHLDRYLADPAADPLLAPVVSGAPGFEPTRAALLDRVVRPAFARYRSVLATEIHPHGRPDDRPGVCWLPGGEAIYAGLARVHTTTDHPAAQLHETGLEVLDGLRAEYAEIGKRVFGTAELAEIFQALTADPAMRWTDGAELLASARAAVSRAEAAAPQWFGVLPRQRCEVRPVPAAEARSAPFAYYFQPTLDGLRPGVYYANTYQAQERDRYLSEVAAFHEAVPGHHLQLTLALERTDLPLLRRLADVNAAIEGWGLYSERLADEMGLYSGDVARLGMLAMDSLRAGRLVVDTGLHAQGWSRAQAIDFLREHAPLSVPEIAREVDRYIVNPGQALSYLVGRLEIERIRRAAERRLGSTFDIRGFHDLILAAGPLPLPLLDQLVSSWDGGPGR